jgi:hypothetical protein
MLDPNHPAAGLPLRVRTEMAPLWRNPHIELRAFPKAWISQPESRFSDPPFSYSAYPETRTEGMRVLNMSFAFVAFKSRLYLSAFVRSAVKRKLKAAISLIVTRGAYVKHVGLKSGGRNKTVLFNDSEAGADRWIKAGKCSPRSAITLYLLNIAQTGLMSLCLIHHYTVLP